MLEILKIALLLTMVMIIATWTLSTFANTIFNAYFVQKEKHIRRVLSRDKTDGE